MVAFLSEAMAALFGGRRRLLAFLPVAVVALAGCAQVGGPSVTFWDIIWAMVAFFFWITVLWMFVAIFGDIWRRDDLSGAMKAVWVLALIILPFLGALIYMVARPKTAGDTYGYMGAPERSAAARNVTDELEKLAKLKASGAITDAEYETLKKNALAAAGA
jgi:putative oligomerization/nucleic acid binding protein/phospholipase D-like protein